MSKVEIEQALMLSTAHMPGPYPGFREVRASEHKHGWVLWVSDIAKSPEWLTPVLEEARLNSCQIIIFDSDVEPIDQLKTWDW